MKISYLLFSFLLCLSLNAQQASLVVDLNAGPEDGFNKFNTGSININNSILIPVVTADNGEELGIIKNGTLSILKGYLRKLIKKSYI